MCIGFGSIPISNNYNATTKPNYNYSPHVFSTLFADACSSTDGLTISYTQYLANLSRNNSLLSQSHVVACSFYARLSCLHCQALAAYLMFSDKLNDDNEMTRSVLHHQEILQFVDFQDGSCLSS